MTLTEKLLAAGGAILGVLVALNGVLVVEALSFRGTLGEHTAGLSNVKDSVSSLEARLGSRIDGVISEITRGMAGAETRSDAKFSSLLEEVRGVGTQVAAVRSSLTASELDMSKVLIGMGLVSEGNIFYTAVIGDQIWAFPGAEGAAVLKMQGIEPQPVTDNLSGYPIMSVSNAVGQTPPGIIPPQ